MIVTLDEMMCILLHYGAIEVLPKSFQGDTLAIFVVIAFPFMIFLEESICLLWCKALEVWTNINRGILIGPLVFSLVSWRFANSSLI